MKKKIQNLLLAGISILFALFMSEMIYRLLIYRSFLIVPKAVTDRHSSFCEYDPLLGWRHKKNIEARFVTSEYAALLRFNSKSLRGPEVAYEKGDDIYRVLILGDSFAEGYTVNLEDSFPEILKKNLAGKIKEKAVETVNTGVGGYSTDQEFLFMREEGQKYRPDLTILMFYDNDVYYNTQPAYWRGGKPYFEIENGALVLRNDPVPKPPAESKQNSAIGISPKSYLFSYLFERLQSKEKNARHELPAHERIRLFTYDPAIENSWLITEKIIQKLKLLVDAGNGAMLVVYIPQADLVYNDLQATAAADKIDKGKPARLLRDICSKSGIKFFDLTGELRSKGRGKRLYFKYDPHWNKNGHKVVGEALAHYVENDVYGH